MDKEFVKEMFINILENEKEIYIMINKERKDEFIEAIPKTIELLENHVKSGYYDIQLEAVCDFLLKEIEDETEERLKKQKGKKQKGKKKSE